MYEFVISRKSYHHNTIYSILHWYKIIMTILSIFFNKIHWIAKIKVSKFIELTLYGIIGSVYKEGEWLWYCSRFWWFEFIVSF